MAIQRRTKPLHKCLRTAFACGPLNRTVAPFSQNRFKRLGSSAPGSRGPRESFPHFAALLEQRRNHWTGSGDLPGDSARPPHPDYPSPLYRRDQTGYSVAVMIISLCSRAQNNAQTSGFHRKLVPNRSFHWERGNRVPAN